MLTQHPGQVSHGERIAPRDVIVWQRKLRQLKTKGTLTDDQNHVIYVHSSATRVLNGTAKIHIHDLPQRPIIAAVIGLPN